MNSLRMNGKLRGLIIAWGIGAFALIQHGHGPEDARQAAQPGQGALTMILVGLALQAARMLVLWLVGRYERDRGIEGTLSPTAAFVLDLVTDGVTVLLFALATFRAITGHLGNL